MPLDDALVGRTYSSTRPYEVGREKIREFADAVGDPNPAYRDADVAKALGHPDVVAPPTFPIVVAFDLLTRMLDDLLVPLHEIMHAEQRFAQVRPVRPGDRLTGTLTIDRIRNAGGSALVFTSTQVRTETGEEVCTAHATVVHSGEAE